MTHHGLTVFIGVNLYIYTKLLGHVDAEARLKVLLILWFLGRGGFGPRFGGLGWFRC